MVNVVIVGCGGVALTRHIPAYEKISDAKLYGFYDIAYDKVEQLAEKYSAKAFKNIDDVLSDSKVDAVIVCTATKYHSEIAIKALNAGKHVLCEKPMASTAVEAKEMLEAARKSGKKLMISHNQRLYAPHAKAKELIESGAIGKVLTFRTCLGIKGPEYSSVNKTTNNWYFSKKHAGRGVVSDVGSHRVDLMRYFFGDVEKVFAYTPTLDKRYPDGNLIDLDDNAITVMQLKSGVVGILITSWTSYSGNDRMTQVFGTEGVLTIYGENYPVMIETRSGEKINYDLGETASQDVVLITDIDKKFIECIVNDSEPFVTGEDGLAVIKTIEAMVKSNETGQWVEVI